MVKPEVTVGHGAVIASGAIVTKNVAAYTIVAGVPAVKVRERQPPAVAERLIALGWWNWSHDRLRETLDDFRSLKAEAFLEKYGG
jgi:serine acetyltransferase